MLTELELRAAMKDMEEAALWDIRRIGLTAAHREQAVTVRYFDEAFTEGLRGLRRRALEDMWDELQKHPLGKQALRTLAQAYKPARMVTFEEDDLRKASVMFWESLQREDGTVREAMSSYDYATVCKELAVISPVLNRELLARLVYVNCPGQNVIEEIAYIVLKCSTNGLKMMAGKFYERLVKAGAITEENKGIVQRVKSCTVKDELQNLVHELLKMFPRSILPKGIGASAMATVTVSYQGKQQQIAALVRIERLKNMLKDDVQAEADAGGNGDPSARQPRELVLDMGSGATANVINVPVDLSTKSTTAGSSKSFKLVAATPSRPPSAAPPSAAPPGAADSGFAVAKDTSSASSSRSCPSATSIPVSRRSIPVSVLASPLSKEPEPKVAPLTFNTLSNRDGNCDSGASTKAASAVTKSTLSMPVSVPVSNIRTKGEDVIARFTAASVEGQSIKSGGSGLKSSDAPEEVDQRRASGDGTVAPAPTSVAGSVPASAASAPTSKATTPAASEMVSKTKTEPEASSRSRHGSVVASGAGSNATSHTSTSSATSKSSIPLSEPGADSPPASRTSTKPVSVASGTTSHRPRNTAVSLQPSKQPSENGGRSTIFSVGGDSHSSHSSGKVPAKPRSEASDGGKAPSVASRSVPHVPALLDTSASPSKRATVDGYQDSIASSRVSIVASNSATSSPKGQKLPPIARVPKPVIEGSESSHPIGPSPTGSRANSERGKLVNAFDVVVPPPAPLVQPPAPVVPPPAPVVPITSPFQPRVTDIQRIMAVQYTPTFQSNPVFISSGRGHRSQGPPIRNGRQVSRSPCRYSRSIYECPRGVKRCWFRHAEDGIWW